MANPTTQVKSTFYDWESGFLWPLDPTANTTFYPGEMIGKNASGYADHFDDSEPMEFLGVYYGIQYSQSSTDSVRQYAKVRRGYRLTIPIASGTVSRVDSNASGGGAVGKIAYAYDSGKVTLDQSALTYANIVGRVVDVGDIASVTTLNSTYSVVVEPFRMRSDSGARTLAATGKQTLNKTDLNKTVLVPNTANLTVTLPAIALTTPGDKLTFVRTADANFTVTLDCNASEKINNATTEGSICLKGDSLELTSDGSEWYITGKNKN